MMIEIMVVEVTYNEGTRELGEREHHLMTVEEITPEVVRILRKAYNHFYNLVVHNKAKEVLDVLPISIENGKIHNYTDEWAEEYMECFYKFA